jgi:hypothetical protein
MLERVVPNREGDEVKNDKRDQRDKESIPPTRHDEVQKETRDADGQHCPDADADELVKGQGSAAKLIK